MNHELRPEFPRTSLRVRERWRRLWLVVLALAALAQAHPVHAQELSISQEQSITPAPVARAPLGWGTKIGLGTVGAVSGFLLHESGHVLANLMLGNVPDFHGLRVWGFLPFFAIRPRITCKGDHCTKHNGEPFGAGRSGEFFILTAGFHVQHVTDEIILSRTPDLMLRDAPIQKGLLAFNVFLSVMYAAGTFTGLEDPHGDLVGAARRSGMHEAWLATLLLVPAGLDTYRYFCPGVPWTPWVSRAAKTSLFGLTFVF